MSCQREIKESSKLNSLVVDIRIQYPEKETFENEERLFPVENTLTRSKAHNGKEIVIVLLGWAGAEHKYLSKYSDFYLKQGCVVVSYITPLRYHFLEPGKLPVIAEKIVQFLTSVDFESPIVFFHVFSNGGSFTYSYILQTLSNPKNKTELDIKGTIFDSAPSPRRLQTSYRAMLSIFANLKIFKYVVACSIVFGLICLVFWYHLKCAFKFCVFGDTLESLNAYESEFAPLTNWMGRIAKMRNHHFLFLYSDADDLVPSDKVEQFAAVAEEHGNKVQKVKFDGSEHVMHFRRYPKEYGNAIGNFIGLTMSENKSKTILYAE